MINLDFKVLLESSLSNYVSAADTYEQSLIEAMRYSLLDGGKRIRPTLLYEFCKLCGGKLEGAIPFACAIEMVHTYSLIHDDLPCMDNDDTRRGKPSTHIKFGEDIALLSGDALLTLAFETMLSEESTKLVGFERASRSAYILSKRIGMFGMIGGQAMDIRFSVTDLNKKILQTIYRKKTGELICASAEIGCIIAGASQKQTECAIEYAKCIGLAFQVVDDIIDFDFQNKKSTSSDNSCLDLKSEPSYVSCLGLDESYKLVKKLTEHAIISLESFETETIFLKDLAIQLSKRTL